MAAKSDAEPFGSWNNVRQEIDEIGSKSFVGCATVGHKALPYIIKAPGIVGTWQARNDVSRKPSTALVAKVRKLCLGCLNDLGRIVVHRTGPFENKAVKCDEIHKIKPHGMAAMG